MLVLPAIAGVVTVVFDTNLLISVILFLVLPSLYLMLRNPGIARKSTIFALLFSVPLSLFIDTLAAINGAWVVPVTVFPFRILGVSTVEVYLYGLFWVLFSVLFYEHFFDKGRKGEGFSRTTKYLIYLSIVLVFSVITLLYSNEPLLHIPYVYFILGTVFVPLPLLLFLYCYPQFTRRYIFIGLYFTAVLLLFEIAALEAGQWIFPGQFIGFIELYGYRFPFEELFIWMIMATPALLSYYEFFVDDRRLA